MVRKYASFSPCGSTFAYCGLDGNFKIWDSNSGVLKQEFVPDLHLKHPFTSYIWLPVSYGEVPSKKPKKRKSGKKEIKTIGLGSKNGSVSLYNLSEGKVVATLQGGHTRPVTSMAWNSLHGLISASDNNICIWDLENKSIVGKWKSGKVSMVGCWEEGDICASGSFSIKLWNLPTRQWLGTLPGHQHQISSLVFINPTHFVSTAADDSYISVWKTDEKEPLARLSLTDNVGDSLSVTEDDGHASIGAVSYSGALNFYQHQFNGALNKSVKPTTVVEIASNSPENSSTNTVEKIPVIAVHLVSPTMALVAYGESPFFSFERIDLKNIGKRICLVRKPTAKVKEKSSIKESIRDDAEYLSGGCLRKRREVPLEDRLFNLCEPEVGEGSTQSMAQLLIQGLESHDRALLDTVLLRKEEAVVRQTISRLPVTLLPLLIKELVTMIQGKSMVSSIGCIWLKYLLGSQAAQLLADEACLSLLANVQSHLESRLSSVIKLHRLAGRLDTLLLQLNPMSTSHPDNMDAVLVYQDEDSSDDASLSDERPPSESEDKWDELSEQEETTDAMST